MREIGEQEFQGHIDNMANNGFTVVENAIDSDLVLELREALDELEQKQSLDYASTEFEGLQTLRIYNLLAKGQAFQKIPNYPNTLSIAEGLLDDGLQLSSLSAIILGPGQPAQPLHADTQMIPIARPHTLISVNCMWALSDFTEANGATRIVPGSHKWPHSPEYGKAYDSIAAEMAGGSVMFFDSAVWHGGGSNQTAQRRYGVACYYCAGWVRPQENQQLGIPVDISRGFSRRLQELCGYSVYNGIYGHIDNRDPIELLGRKRKGMMVWEASDKVRS